MYLVVSSPSTIFVTLSLSCPFGLSKKYNAREIASTPILNILRFESIGNFFARLLMI